MRKELLTKNKQEEEAQRKWKLVKKPSSLTASVLLCWREPFACVCLSERGGSGG